MKNRDSSQFQEHPFGKKAFLAVLGLLVLVFLWMLKPFWSALFMAVVLTTLTFPLYKWLEKRLVFKSAASLVTLLILILLIFVPVLMLLTLGYREALHLADTFEPAVIQSKIQNLLQIVPKTISKPIQTMLESWQASPQSLFQSSSATLKNIAAYLYSGGASLSKSLLQVILQGALCLLCMFYFFMDGPKMVRQIIHLSPLPDHYETQLIERFIQVNKATIRGTLVIGIIQGVLGGSIFWILDIPSPIFWIGIMIFLSVIPALGASGVLIPAAIILFLSGRWGGGLFLLIAASVISLLDNFLRPILVGKKAQMHDLLIIFSTLGGIGLFGIIGLILGPVIAALLITASEFYSEIFHSELAQNAGQKKHDF